MGAPALSLRFSLFLSLSLYVTPQQINSLLILISQEITFTFLLHSSVFFLFARTAQAHILLHASVSISASLSLSGHKRTHVHPYERTAIHMDPSTCNKTACCTFNSTPQSLKPMKCPAWTWGTMACSILPPAACVLHLPVTGVGFN